jgi:hypothetical protein
MTGDAWRRWRYAAGSAALVLAVLAAAGVAAVVLTGPAR